MIAKPSENTKALLLLWLKNMGGRALEPLTPSPLKAILNLLREKNLEPKDLTKNPTPDLLEAVAIAASIKLPVTPERLQKLLSRGMALANRLKTWLDAGIWVISQLDELYPKHLFDNLGREAPLFLFGCGSETLLERSGLAIVGSRNVSQEILDYTGQIAELCAKAKVRVVSGGAMGIDVAAMRGAAQAGGTVIGVVAHDLIKTALLKENRMLIEQGRGLLLTPFDPETKFNANNKHGSSGQLMARNKLIYAFAQAALVVNATHGKGGTWTGAVEQLEKFKNTALYTRQNPLGQPEKERIGLRELEKLGAKPWPEPQNPDQLLQLLKTNQPQSTQSNEPDNPTKKTKATKSTKTKKSKETGKQNQLFNIIILLSSIILST